MSKQDPPLRAVVTKVVGQHPANQSYVVTRPQQNAGGITTSESVTFSIGVWKGPALRVGTVVDLYGVTRHIKGWRAERAEPVTPTTEKQT